VNASRPSFPDSPRATQTRFTRAIAEPAPQRTIATATSHRGRTVDVNGPSPAADKSAFISRWAGASVGSRILQRSPTPAPCRKAGLHNNIMQTCQQRRHVQQRPVCVRNSGAQRRTPCRLKANTCSSSPAALHHAAHWPPSCAGRATRARGRKTPTDVRAPPQTNPKAPAK